MSPSDPFLLAVDLGTSGPKVALVTLGGAVAACEVEYTGLLFLPGGGVEQDPEEWWAAIVRATRRLLAASGVRPEQVIGLNCASQWSCTVPVGPDGRALGNAISWMDTRGEPYVRQITGGPLRIEGYGVDKLAAWLPLTGGIPTRSGKDSIAHILFLQRERPEIYRETRNFLEPKDYLNLRLTGQWAATHDSIILHWLTDNRDLRRMDYHPRLLRLAGVTRDVLIELAQVLRLTIREVPLTRHELYNADEAFLTSTIKEVLPVSWIDGRRIGTGSPGPITRRLHQAFRELVQSAWSS